MLVEINEIKGFVFNIDGFFHYDGMPNLQRDKIWTVIDIGTISAIKIRPELQGLIDVIKDKYPFRFVSKLPLESISKICKDNKLEVAPENFFTATSEFEKTLLFYEPIKRARDSMGLLSCQTVYITADANTLDKAIKLHMGTMIFDYDTVDILEEEGTYRCGADFVLDEIWDLGKVIAHQYLGYLAEVEASPDNMIDRSAKERFIQVVQIPNKDMPDSKIFVAGRYFPIDDSRHAKHALSIRIPNSKNNPERHKEFFARILKRSAEWVSKGKYDLITRIPPRPSEGYDRIKSFLETIPLEYKDYDKSKIAADILECVQDYPKQKFAGSYEDRKQNVRGAFNVTSNVKDKIIVVVDDIMTSGATLYEVTRILLEAGCKKVYPIAVAFTPSGKVRNGDGALECAKCGGKLMPRCGTKTGYVFFGCRNYFDGGEHDRLEFKDGVRMLNELTSPPEPEILFDDIPF